MIYDLKSPIETRQQREAKGIRLAKNNKSEGVKKAIFGGDLKNYNSQEMIRRRQ